MIADMTGTQSIDTIISLRRQFVAPVAKPQHLDLVDESVLQAKPLVLLLGNHSSGKSSFINHLLDRDVQRTGVAPTDDGFTVILHSKDARSIDGEALTTNPDLPFAELGHFGPGLVQHVAGRGLDAQLLQHVSLIDSPGMIDSAGGEESQRPYDFPAAVRWFADKADLILLFFDPEKPGTTGETIQILTESLAGIDHKLRIVMNKMDLFDGMRDFARTYGALCWNLSRSLQTKDMPHIYTTVLPNQVREDCKLPLDGFAAALLELEAYIAELPSRRADSVLSLVIDEARQLVIRTRVTERFRNDVSMWRLRSLMIGALSCGISAAYAAWVWRSGAGVIDGLQATIPCLLFILATVFIPGWLATWRERRGIDSLDSFFREEFTTELNRRERAEDLGYDWQRAAQGLRRILGSNGLAGIGRVSRSRIVKLERCIEQDLRNLRTVS